MGKHYYSAVFLARGESRCECRNSNPDAPEILETISQEPGVFEIFKEQFAFSVAKCFGSGWARLALTDGGLGIDTIPSQISPLILARISHQFRQC